MTSPNIVMPFYSFFFWTAYFIQMRPYLLFVSGVAGATGIAIAGESDTPHWKMILAFIPFFLGYGFGQALTDCFQTDTDKISAPYRPLSKGIISVRAVLTVSLVGLTCSGIIFSFLHHVSLLLSVAAVAGLATYSYFKRHYWFAGPFYNAWIVALLPAIGYYAVATTASKELPFFLFPYIFISFFSYSSFVLIGYLKDIDADRATNYNTFPVIFGWSKTILLGDVIALVTISLFWFTHPKEFYEVLLGVAASMILLAGNVIAHLSKQKNEKEALIPILSTVRSFVLFHLAIILHFQSNWWPMAIIFYAVFECALFLRPSRYQV
jgi:4-hydroxybenzoate polyprenyltransferase